MFSRNVGERKCVRVSACADVWFVLSMQHYVKPERERERERVRKRQSTNERTNIDTKVTFLLLFIASTKFCDFGFEDFENTKFFCDFPRPR